MTRTLLLAFALMLVLEGILPFLAPQAWRETFRRLVSDEGWANPFYRSELHVDRSHPSNGFQMNWLLPDYVADALPQEAARIEALRRTVLDLFRVHGYEFVMPPLLEHLDSLLTGSGSDLKLRTFKIVDQLSGRTLGSGPT